MVQRYSALAALAATAAASPLTIRQANNDTTNGTITSFKDVPVTKHLEYIPCFENFTCTNIEVPLDYENPDIGTTNIAFMKYAAPKQPAKGDIVYNPGGPGDSAVGLFLNPEVFPKLPRLLGDEWNIIAMDPRGIWNSGPNLNCFPGEPSIRDYYDQELSRVDTLSQRALKEYHVGTAGMGEWCSRTLTDEANYANTPATAQDMLHYAELLAESCGEAKEDAKLNFYGASYGSSLGNVFLQIFPDRVGRFIIDANMDAEDYFWGSWGTSLDQADDTVGAFIEYCFKSGPNCPFYANDSSAEALHARFDALITKLEEEPISVTDPEIVTFPVVVTDIDLKTALLTTMYDWATWSSLALTLAALEAGDGSLLAAVNTRGVIPGTNPPEYAAIQPKLIVACNDNNKRYNISSFEDLNDLFADHRSRSKYFGDTWPLVILPQCRNLRFAPPEHQIVKEFKKIKTSNPVLFINNVIDPVTSAQEKMAAFYEESAIVLQDSVGHGTFVAPSKCMTKHVVSYLSTGELPPEGIVCPVEFDPFDPALLEAASEAAEE